MMMKARTKGKSGGKTAAQKRPSKEAGTKIRPEMPLKFESRDEIGMMVSARGEMTNEEREKLIDAVQFVMNGPLNSQEVGEAFLMLWECEAANGARFIDEDFATHVFKWPRGTAQRLAFLYQEGRWAEADVAANNNNNLNQDAPSRNTLERRLGEISVINGEQKKKVLDLLEVIARAPLKPQTVGTEFHTLWHLRTEMDAMELDKIIDHILHLKPGKARSLALAIEDRWIAQQGNTPGSVNGQANIENHASNDGAAEAITADGDNQNTDQIARADYVPEAEAEIGDAAKDTTPDPEVVSFDVLDPELNERKTVDHIDKPFKDEPLADSERTPLSDQEAATLQKCKRVINSGFKAFVDVGWAFSLIMRQKLYRQTHKRFAEFCDEILGMSYRRAYQLRDSAEFIERLKRLNDCSKKGGASELPMPKNENQIRPLAGLPPDEQLEAWKEANEESPDADITGKMLKRIVRARKKKVAAKNGEQTQQDKTEAQTAAFDSATELSKTIEWLNSQLNKWPSESRHVLIEGIGDWQKSRLEESK